MSKQNDMIFIGPQAGGKTTLFQVLQGKEPPKVHTATISNGEPATIRTIAIPKFLGLINGKISVIDAGGKPTEFNNYKNWCQKAERIVIVFNGIKLLEEVEKCKEGGETTSFCKMSLSQLHEIGVSNLYFVATHADQYSGRDGMCEEIQKRIKQANEEYTSLFSSSKRYPMFSDILGRLYEVNATDPISVKKVFNSILSQ